MADLPQLDTERLTYAWESGEDYDSTWLIQPWDDPNITVAHNDVANGWACRIDNVILVEESTGRRVAEAFETAAAAEAAWPDYERAYGSGETVVKDILN